jgi:putative chitinase
MELTLEQLKQCLPHSKNTQELLEALLVVLPKYEINSVERIAAFLAQCGHESVDFTVLRENLNYGAAGLKSTFGKYFKSDDVALAYQRKPEKIANRVYANRMGNGTEESGDGYKYRGRGAIQLTGHDNYAAFAVSVAKSIEETVTYCETLEGAIESACWFWTKNHCNVPADSKDMLALTKKINGGTIGLEERTSHFNRNLQVLA